MPDRPLAVKDIGLAIARTRARELLTIAGGTLLAGVLAMSVPLAMSYLLDSVIPDENLLKVLQVAAALAALGGMTFVIRVATQLTLLRIEGLEGARLQAAVMDRMLRLPTGFFRGFTTGDLGTRVMAIARLEKALTASMVSSVTTGMIALVSYGLMLAYSWRLGLVAILLTLVLAAITFGLGLLRVRAERTAIARDARMSGLTLELAAGITKLRLAAAEDRAFLRWRAFMPARAARNMRRTGHRGCWRPPVPAICCSRWRRCSPSVSMAAWPMPSASACWWPSSAPSPARWRGCGGLRSRRWNWPRSPPSSPMPGPSWRPSRRWTPTRPIPVNCPAASSCRG